MKKYACIIVFMLVAIASTRAQVLKKLQDKASRAVNRSIDNAANKAVDKAVTKPIDKAVDKALDPAPKNKKQSGSKASVDAGSNTPSNTEQDNPQQLESPENPVKSSLRSPADDAKDAPETGPTNAVQIGDPCATKEELATALGKYFTASSQSPANPEFMTIAFRYAHMPAHLRLINNFTKNFEDGTWQKLLAFPGK